MVLGALASKAAPDPSDGFVAMGHHNVEIVFAVNESSIRIDSCLIDRGLSRWEDTRIRDRPIPKFDA
jgi:hypothetical protein